MGDGTPFAESQHAPNLLRRNREYGNIPYNDVLFGDEIGIIFTYSLIRTSKQTTGCKPKNEEEAPKILGLRV